MKSIMIHVQEYIFLFLVFLIPGLLIMYISRRRSDSRYPPSPPSIPIIGHLHLLSPIPHQALHKLSKKYGSIMRINLGSVPCVVASSPEAAKEFLKTQEIYFSNRPQSLAIDYITYGSQDFAFAPYGPYWKFMKKLCMSELLCGRTLDLLQPVRHDEIKKLIESLYKKAKAGEEVDLGEVLIRMSNNVISRMVMSKRCSENKEDAADVRKLIRETTELTGKFNLSDYICFFKRIDLQGFNKRLQNVSQRFDKMMEEIIEEHHKAEKKDDGGQKVKDLLDILLEISEDESSENRLTREKIKAFILDIFVAGSDTSAVTLEWSLAELINHPNIMQKALQEIDQVVGKERLVMESDIPNLPYLQAIVKETLRLHPAGPLISRESSEDCIVNGYEIQAKTRVFINVWAIGRDTNYWEIPFEFLPERFISGCKKQTDLRGQHYELLPFGSGRRGCPGTSLALLVVQTTLAALIQCFEWKVKNKEKVVNMEEGPGLNLPRAHPLVCVPVARLDQQW